MQLPTPKAQAPIVQLGKIREACEGLCMLLAPFEPMPETLEYSITSTVESRQAKEGFHDKNALSLRLDCMAPSCNMLQHGVLLLCLLLLGLR